MIFNRLNILLLFLILLSATLFSQEATAVLKDKQIKIGDQTTIELELRTTADGQTVEFPTLMDTISGKIEIVKISEMDTSYDENDITIRVLSQTITITSWDSGFHVVPPFIFKVGDAEFKTKADLLEVLTVPIEAEADIKDIKAIMEVPFSLWDWILVHKYEISAIILLIILTIAGILIYKRMKKEKHEETIFVPKEKADVVALRQLKELELAKLWQNDQVNAYYTQLSHIIREYLENRFRISALERTTDEIRLLMQFHKELNDSAREKLSELLALADMAKFAKQEPLASENEDALKYAFKFVEETKLVESVSEEQDELSLSKSLEEEEKGSSNE